MKELGGTLATLAGYFALMSLFAIGGANSAIPEMHRFAVDVEHYLTDQQFDDTFALAQLTPGPNVIIVTLIGYRVAGLIGAVVTTLAMCGPTCVFALFVGRASERFRGAVWHAVLSRALIPVTLGLTASSATVIATITGYNLAALAITLGTALTAYFVRVHPLWAFAVAGLARARWARMRSVARIQRSKIRDILTVRSTTGESSRGRDLLHRRRARRSRKRVRWHVVLLICNPG